MTGIINKWLVAVTVTIATFMELLDTSAALALVIVGAAPAWWLLRRHGRVPPAPSSVCYRRKIRAATS